MSIYNHGYDSILHEYRQKHPYLSKRKLAKLIEKDKTVPHPWEVIRKYIPPLTSQTDVEIDFNKEFNIDLPESWYKNRTPFIIPKRISNLLIISDLQIPFHDNRAISAALKYGLDNGIDGILINGDLADCYSLSTFIKDSKYRDFEAETHSVTQFLKTLRSIFKDIPIYWKKGNHEFRIERYITEKVPDLAWYKGLSLEQLYGTEQLQIEVIDDKRVMQYGQLYIIHGHEYRGSGAVNIARNLLLKAFDNILCSHFHRMDEHYWTPVSGNSIGSWVTGCLCGLQPDYMPLNNWIHGFATVKKNDDDTFEVDNHKIIHGRVY